MSEDLKNNDWTCGGWAEVEREKLRRMASLTLEEKLRWLEEAGKFVDDVKAWRHSRGLPTLSQNDEIEW